MQAGAACLLPMGVFPQSLVVDALKRYYTDRDFNYLTVAGEFFSPESAQKVMEPIQACSKENDFTEQSEEGSYLKTSRGFYLLPWSSLHSAKRPNEGHRTITEWDSWPSLCNYFQDVLFYCALEGDGNTLLNLKLGHYNLPFIDVVSN